MEYNSMDTTTMSIIINEINNQDTVKRSSFMEKFSLKLVINTFSQKGQEETNIEMLHIHQRTVFKPIKVSYLNPTEKKEHYNC